VDEYAASIGYVRPNLGRDFLQHYEATGWRLKDGTLMSNWKWTVQTWRRTEESNPPKGATGQPEREPQPGDSDWTPTEEELEARKQAWQTGGSA